MIRSLARGVWFVAGVWVCAIVLISCRSPARPTAPRAPQVDRDHGFECHPGETWGECLERECQRRARCL